MGAFLLIRKPENVKTEHLEETYRASIEVFHKKGLPLNERIVTRDFIIYVFHKNRIKVGNFLRFDDNQFIISTGTLIYNKKIGQDALEELYQDFSPKGEFLSKVFGQYSLIVSKEGRLYLLNDTAGVYHVYSNKSKGVISSSFLAVLKALPEKSISPQELYEYVFNSSFFGDQTLIKQIELIDSKTIWQLSPELSAIRKATPPVIRLDKTGSFDEMVEGVSSNLIDYFSILKAAFGDSICSSITGGFDSRLMLALMRKVGISPHLYIYGSEDSANIRIAKLITKGVGLAIEHEDWSKFPGFAEDEFPELLEKQYYLRDGLGHETGTFGSIPDLNARLKRAEKGRLQLNGTGGEIYRNFWVLPDRSLHIKSFLRSFYDRADYAICTDHFDKDAYFSTLVKKFKFILDVDRDRLDPEQIKMLYPFMRLKYWMGNNQTINNLITYSLLPYAEPRLTFQSLDIPVRFKQSGIFEAALIKFIDPDLARFPSEYGFNFYDGAGLSTRLKDSVTMYTPTSLRPFIRRHIWNHGWKLLRPRSHRNGFPFYFGKVYLDRIFASNQLSISQYIHVDKINDLHTLARVLSAELMVTDRF
jgi:hypothetical protein